MSNRLVGGGSPTHNRGRRHLSPLAQEILVRLTNGQSIKAIASALGTTRDIVDGRARTIYRHFRVKGVAQLVHAAIREGWITHPAEQAGNNGYSERSC